MSVVAVDVVVPAANVTVDVIAPEAIVVDVTMPPPVSIDIIVREGPAGPQGPPGPQGPEGKWLSMTQAEYDALTQPDPNVLYIIIG